VVKEFTVPALGETNHENHFRSFRKKAFLEGKKNSGPDND